MTQPTTINEVSPLGALLWEIQFPLQWGIYRSSRVPENHGFVLPGGI
jgi:hypothetical protein